MGAPDSACRSKYETAWPRETKKRREWGAPDHALLVLDFFNNQPLRSTGAIWLFVRRRAEGSEDDCEDMVDCA